LLTSADIQRPGSTTQLVTSPKRDPTTPIVIITLKPVARSGQARNFGKAQITPPNCRFFGRVRLISIECFRVWQSSHNRRAKACKPVGTVFSSRRISVGPFTQWRRSLGINAFPIGLAMIHRP